MIYLKAFLVGGVICALSQVLIDRTRLTPARILSAYVVLGIVLPGVGLWGPRSVPPGWPTGCWPCRPAISARHSVSSAPRSATEPSAPPRPSGLPPPPGPVCCGPPGRASASGP